MCWNVDLFTTFDLLLISLLLFLTLLAKLFLDSFLFCLLRFSFLALPLYFSRSLLVCNFLSKPCFLCFFFLKFSSEGSKLISCAVIGISG